MDVVVGTKKKRNPRENANCLSVLTFSWVMRIFFLGFKKELESEDLYRPLDEHTSNVIGDRLSAAWSKELELCSQNKCEKRRNPSLKRALISVFGLRHALFASFVILMELVVRPLQPYAIGYYLLYFKDDHVSKYEACLYAGGIILASTLYLFFSTIYIMEVYHLSMKLRLACSSLVYRKALKLSKIGIDQTTVGKAVNILSNDVGRFDTNFVGLHYLWIGPSQTILTTYLMYQEVGIAAICGVIIFLSFIPLQFWFAKITAMLRLRTAKATDKRICATNEVIRGIQAIKMYTWEYLFREMISKLRNSEMNAIKRTTLVKSIVQSFCIYAMRLSLFATIFIYVIDGGTISAEKVFILTAFYQNLQFSMSTYFSNEITNMAELNVSMKRIETFLMRSEFQSSDTIVTSDVKKDDSKSLDDMRMDGKSHVDARNEKHDELSVIFRNVHAKWSNNIFNGINLNIGPGELVAIVGKVGAGKSSLLNVILKELPVTKGTIIVPDKISYASQEPWLFSASVRQNILFGRPMDDQKYHEVIKVCQLEHDFTLLPFGDKTIVGERGVNLSGGQKARINLARAVYSDSSLYLLDDPLSAVDAHVGKLLFEECIRKYLHGRTRILVTHQIQTLHNVDRVIVLRKGEVIASGTYEQLMNMGVDIGALGQLTSDAKSQSIPHNRADSCVSTVPSQSLPVIKATEKDPKEVEETRTRGKVDKQLYVLYLKAGGNCCVVSMILSLYVITQMSASGFDWFFSFWIRLQERNQTKLNNHQMNSTMNDSIDYDSTPSKTMCMYIFGLLITVTVVSSILRSLSFFRICIRASKRLHDEMFHSIVRATMHFLNTNSSGRILNRFTKDMSLIDESLPITFIDCIRIGLEILGILVVVSVANPWLLIPSVIISVAFYFFRLFYVTTSRSIKRLEGVNRSLIYNHFSATLEGLTTIRSFGARAILTKEFDRHQDSHSSAWYLYIVTSRAFAFWLSSLNLIYTFFVTISFLLIPKGMNFPSSANVGLAITQCFGLVGRLQWGMRQSAELENRITSVERVNEYKNIDSEPPLESSPEKKPPNDWPREGKILFENVFLRYRSDATPVLKNINFVIKPREHVGIMGRTGAGKSSLVSALFRLAHVEGRIVIDDVDTGDIGLHDLRSKISIIPQEPFLFSGTLRKNLDPFNEYGDDVLWLALKDVQLHELGLDMHISNGGTNLSVGQRQLVCLARAIVKRNKFLILDEATANIDLRTDEFIQMTIRQKFADCTSLTIAHRLNTVIDSDRILVMDAGNVVEFDHPYVLLRKKNSFLSNMMSKAGTAIAETMLSVAKENYERRQLSSTTL